MAKIVSLKEAERKRRVETVKRRIGRPLHIAVVVIVIAVLAVVAWPGGPKCRNRLTRA